MGWRERPVLAPRSPAAHREVAFSRSSYVTTEVQMKGELLAGRRGCGVARFERPLERSGCKRDSEVTAQQRPGGGRCGHLEGQVRGRGAGRWRIREQATSAGGPGVWERW